MIVKHNPSRNKQFINFQDGGDAFLDFNNANSIVNNNPILMIKSSKYINSGEKNSIFGLKIPKFYFSINQNCKRTKKNEIFIFVRNFRPKQKYLF